MYGPALVRQYKAIQVLSTPGGGGCVRPSTSKCCLPQEVLDVYGPALVRQ